MTKVANAGEDHGEAVLVCRGDDLISSRFTLPIAAIGTEELTVVAAEQAA